MTTKYYTNRRELYEDMEFIYDLRIPYDVKQKLLDELFESWKDYSPDSPWYKNNHLEMKKEEYDACNTLVSISRGEGISSEWKGEHIVFEDVNGKNKQSNRKNNKSKKHDYNLRSR
jgi:hypothetical protein